MRWLLPEHIEDILPAGGGAHRARCAGPLLDHVRGRGYELVMPPLLEYVESLLTGTGHDLDLRTFKLVDQLSGRMMGVRADITPQVARIDAHLLNRKGVTRLCYCGSVLHARPAGTRGDARAAADRRGDLRPRRRRERSRDPAPAVPRARGGGRARRAHRRRPRRGVPRAGAGSRGSGPSSKRSCSRRCRKRTFRRCAALTRALGATPREALLLPARAVRRA